jgi:hypothetical protein
VQLFETINGTPEYGSARRAIVIRLTEYQKKGRDGN